MSKCGCIVPLVVRLQGVPDEALLAEMTETIARTVARRLQTADRTMAAREGWQFWQKTHAAPQISFSGSAIDADLAQRVTAAIKAGIANALSGLPAAAPQTSPFVLAQYHPPAPKPTADVTWRIHSTINFHIKPGDFFRIRQRLGGSESEPDEVDPLELYFPLLDTPRPAVAWVVEVLREYEFKTLTSEIIRRFGSTRPSGEYEWSINGWFSLRASIVAADQDHLVGRQVPEFTERGYSENRPGPGEGEQQRFLRPGAWVLSVFLSMPLMRLDDLVKIQPPQMTDLTVREAAEMVTPEDVRADLGLDLAQVVRAVPDVTVTVFVEPFTVRRKVHTRALAALFAQLRLQSFATKRLGRIVSLTDDALNDLPPTLQSFLVTLGKVDPPAKRAAADKDFWLPNAHGVNLTLIFPNDLDDQALLALNASFIVSQADKAQHVLTLKNTWVSMDRNHALTAFLIDWERRNHKLFGFMLDELKRRGALDAFLDAILDLSLLDTYYQRIAVALAQDTPYQRNTRILTLKARMEAFSRSAQKHTYDVDAQEIWFKQGDARIRLKAANGSSDDTAGVVAVVLPYFSETSRIPQPKPEVLKKLQGPVREKVAKTLTRLMCQRGETMSREQLLQKATQEAANALPPLDEKDLVNVTMIQTLRVLKLERRMERGMEETYVHYQPVRKIGDNPWVPFDAVIVGSAIAFEAYLTYYHVEHLKAALTIFFLAETVLVGGMLIIGLGLASGTALLFFVGIQVALYWWHTDAEDRTLEGYLVAALKGELDAVGFKLLSGAVKSLGGFVAERYITGEVVGKVATKWIMYGLRGTVMGLGVGSMEVTYQFAEDLMRYSVCEGWSSPATYWKRFAYGFAFTLGFEFLAAPILAPPLRLLLERAGDSPAVARILRMAGKKLPEMADALLEGSEKVNEALTRTVEHEAIPAMTQSLRERVNEVLKALGREYESQAYHALLEAYGADLSPEAARGLRRLLKTASEGEIDTILARLRTAKAPPADLLRALDKMDEALAADLAKAGQLGQLGVSKRLLALLTKDPETGARLLRGPFKSKVGDCERFLGRLEPLPSDAQESVLRALLQGHALPPDILLGAAKQVGALDEPTLALLRRLQDAQIRVGALFDGSGKLTLKEFADDFAKLSEAERAAALDNAAGRSPAQVLEQAKRPTKPPTTPETPKKPPAAADPPKSEPPKPAPAPAPKARTLAEIERELQAKGLTSAELRKFAGAGRRMSANVAKLVERLMDHFTPEEVRKLGEFLSDHGLALNEDTVDLFISNVPKGKLNETIRSLEIAHVRGEATHGAEWTAEELAAQEDQTIHPGKPPRISEFEETPGNTVLRSALIERSGEQPPPGYHAHHVVPEKQFGPGLDWMRNRLEQAGSGINKADNGAFLAGSKSTANPELTRLHNSYMHAGPTIEYAYTLTRRLADKTGAPFLEEVRKIGQEMVEGKFNTLEIPQGWKTKWQPGMTAPINTSVEPVWITD